MHPEAFEARALDTSQLTFNLRIEMALCRLGTGSQHRYSAYRLPKCLSRSLKMWHFNKCMCCLLSCRSATWAPWISPKVLLWVSPPALALFLQYRQEKPPRVHPKVGITGKGLVNYQGKPPELSAALRAVGPCTLWLRTSGRIHLLDESRIPALPTQQLCKHCFL